MMLVFVVIPLNAIVLVLVIRPQWLSALLKDPDRSSWGHCPRENVKQIQGKTAALPFTTYLLKVIPPQMFYSCFGNEDIICHSLSQGFYADAPVFSKATYQDGIQKWP